MPSEVIEKEENGERLEPFEMVDIELPEEFSGAIVNMLAERKGAMLDMGAPTAEGMQAIQYEARGRSSRAQSCNHGDLRVFAVGVGGAVARRHGGIGGSGPHQGGDGAVACVPSCGPIG